MVEVFVNSPCLMSIYGQSMPNHPMDTCGEIRLKKLEILIQRYGSIADLNVALKLSKADATLSQIRNKSPHSKTGKPRTMGDEIARRIENTLQLERGWMDNLLDPCLSEDEIKVLSAFRMANSSHKAALLAQAKAVLDDLPTGIHVVDPPTKDFEDLKVRTGH